MLFSYIIIILVTVIICLIGFIIKQQLDISDKRLVLTYYENRIDCLIEHYREISRKLNR